MAVDDPIPAGPAGGDEAETFKAFFRHEYRAVVAWVSAITGDFQAAEDIAQEAFMAAGQRWNSTKQLRA